MSDVSEPEDGIKVRVQHNHTCSHGRSDSSSRSSRSTPSKRWETRYFVECDSAHDTVELSELEDNVDEKECPECLGSDYSTYSVYHVTPVTFSHGTHDVDRGSEMKVTESGATGERRISRRTTPATIVLAHLLKLGPWDTVICPEDGCSKVIRSINIGDEEVFVNDFEPIRRESDGAVTSYMQRLRRKVDGRILWNRHFTVLSLTDKSEDYTLLHSIEEYCYERKQGQAQAQNQAQDQAGTEDTELAQSMSALAVSNTEDEADSGLGDDATEGGSG
ncbi:hypothetical protein JCM24511_03878 [Saitozyma sp. JCM 24511]|nr:hypothetical protein JCM24511_03878 [Saitozyma sp. JCM 24511]